jgi:hypothetical protein
MSDVTESKRTYPYLATSVWAELKSRFQKSLPQKVTPSYLQSALGYESEKAAKNLIPQLRALGLIDAESSTTDLASRFRMDSDYAAATQEMVAAVYPEELRDLYPGPEEDLASVANWFMRDTGGGQSSAVIQARFYLSLVSGKLPASEKSARAPKPATGAAKKPSGVAPKASQKATNVRSEVAVTPVSAPVPALPSAPGLHLDIQIHIDSAATADQIDQVFASMAKHLYGRG